MGGSGEVGTVFGLSVEAIVNDLDDERIADAVDEIRRRMVSWIAHGSMSVAFCGSDFYGILQK